MKSFRFIFLSNISVACIFIISATSSSASNNYDFLDFISSPIKALIKTTEIIYKACNTSELYLFLKEAQVQSTQEHQYPSEKFQKNFEGYTTSPIINSYLGYYKLHNISISSWRPAIAWGRIILRVHNDNKVTGWILRDGGATYKTIRVSEDITEAFLGEVTNNSIEFHRVTEKGINPKDGHEKYYALTWNHAHNVLMGKWNGSSIHATPKDQHGNVHISMIAHSHSFNMNDIKEKWKLKDEDLIELPPCIEKKIDKFIKSSDTSRFPYIFNYQDQERLISYYAHKAWDCYAENLPSDIKSKKCDILKFKVNLKHQLYSDTLFNINGQQSPVPMQFSLFPPWILNISTGTFCTDMVEDKKRFKSRLSLIAHEVLGHGIFSRYSRQFINNIANELLKENFKTDIEIGGNKQTINISSYQDKDRHAIKAIEEGLAVAVEYAVYQKEKNICIDLSEYMKIRYINPNGKKAELYQLGVDFLRKKEIIDKDGKLNFSKIFKDPTK